MLERAGMFGRYAISSGLAVGVTFGLFFLMQALVAMGNATLDEKKETRVIDFVRVKRSQALQQKERELPNRPKSTDAPPTPNMNLNPSVGDVSTGAMAIAAPTAVPSQMRAPPKLGGAPADRGLVPLVRLKPPYPMRAAQDGVEGYVRMRFDVDPDGHVKNISVIDAKPRGVFETAATRTMAKWRYRAKTVNGKGVWVRGPMVRMPYKLNN
jgi:protein TonB